MKYIRWIALIVLLILVATQTNCIKQQEEASSLQKDCNGDVHARVSQLRAWMRKPKIDLDTRRKIHAALKYLNEVCLWAENNNDPKVSRRIGVVVHH